MGNQPMAKVRVGYVEMALATVLGGEETPLIFRWPVTMMETEKTDVAVYRTSTGAWYVIPSSGATPYGLGWKGNPSDVPVTTNPN